jgi:predicted alpha/beta hydrolase
MDIREEKLEITARDGRVLSAVLVAPERPTSSVLISPAVAIRKEPYLRFAREAAGRGAAVLVYDYRGQGGSVGPDIRADHVSFAQWGRLDMAAAIDHLDRLYPDLEMTAIGHSVGAWLVGLAENQHRIHRHAFICAGWGYWKLKPIWYKPVEMTFWYLHGPLCIKLFGHIPRGGPWQGEPLNASLFNEWKAWCHTPTCEASFMAGGPDQPHFYDQVTAPIRSFAYRDDPIANERSVPMLLAVYPNAKQETVWAGPKDFGLQKIGHQSLFSGRNAKAWEPVLDWAIPRK